MKKNFSSGVHHGGCPVRCSSAIATTSNALSANADKNCTAISLWNRGGIVGGLSPRRKRVALNDSRVAVR